jgi:hypothetical protein
VERNRLEVAPAAYDFVIPSRSVDSRVAIGFFDVDFPMTTGITDEDRRYHDLARRI